MIKSLWLQKVRHTCVKEVWTSGVKHVDWNSTSVAPWLLFTHHIYSIVSQCFARWLPDDKLWGIGGDKILPRDIHGYEHHM